MDRSRPSPWRTVASRSGSWRLPAASNRYWPPAPKVRPSVPVFSTPRATRQNCSSGRLAAKPRPTEPTPQSTERTTNSNWPSRTGSPSPAGPGSPRRPASPRLAASDTRTSTPAATSSRRPQRRRRRGSPPGPAGRGPPQPGGGAGPVRASVGAWAAGGAVTLHDVVEADGRLFLVMELVEAPTLRELVEGSGPRPPAAAARVGLELLEALDAAHRAGIVHHDVKPANVMVTPDGRAKLADFGIASLQEDTQRTLGAAAGAGDRTMTAAFGSLPYVAPEQAGDRRAGPAADLWALGATLWFAVEGAPPFQRPSPAATLAAILHAPPGRPWRAGPLEPVLLALLAKDPAQRPPAAALRRLLEPLA